MQQSINLDFLLSPILEVNWLTTKRAATITTIFILPDRI